MTTEEKQQTINAQINELYSAIGEFVVKFEQIIYCLHEAILSLLKKAGLRNERISRGLITGLTAGPLCTLFETLLAETVLLNKREAAIIKEIVQRFRKLIRERNETCHSMWFIGWGDEGSLDFSTALGLNYRKKGRGYQVTVPKRKAEHFRTLANEAELYHKCLAG